MYLLLLYDRYDSVRFLLADGDIEERLLKDDFLISPTLCFNSFTTPLTLSGALDCNETEPQSLP